MLRLGNDACESLSSKESPTGGGNDGRHLSSSAEPSGTGLSFTVEENAIIVW